MDRTDRLADSLGISLRELAVKMGLSKASFFGYRAGTIPLSRKAWAKLEEAERQAKPAPVLREDGRELDHLRAENERLRNALRRIVSLASAETGEPFSGPGPPLELVKKTPDPRRSELPFFGEVAAGQPAASDFFADDTRTVPGEYGPAPHFILRIRGRSMEPDYPHGSFVIVRALQNGEYATKNQVVVIHDGDGASIKRLEYRKAGKAGETPRKPTPHLVSINPEFGEVIPLDDTPIKGVVVDVLPAGYFGRNE